MKQMDKIREISVCPSALLLAHVDSIWCVWRLHCYSDLTMPSLLRPGAAKRIFGPRFYLYLHIISSPARCGSPLLDDFCLSLTSVPTKFENIKLFHILTLQHASRPTFALGNPKVRIIASTPVLFQVEVLLIIVYLLPKSLGCTGSVGHWRDKCIQVCKPSGTEPSQASVRNSRVCTMASEPFIFSSINCSDCSRACKYKCIYFIISYVHHSIYHKQMLSIPKKGTLHKPMLCSSQRHNRHCGNSLCKIKMLALPWIHLNKQMSEFPVYRVSCEPCACCVLLR